MSGRVSAYRERNSTADRALEILAMFRDDVAVISGFAVADELGVARSTAYRYLQSLVTSRFLEEAPGGGFRLGVRVLELARLARKGYGLSELAMPVMAELAASAGETVLLTRWVDDVVVCLDRVESQAHRVRISYERGSTFPLNAGAAALVLLAWADPVRVRAVLESAPLPRFTPATVTDVDAVVRRLDRIRAAGYAVTCGELDPEVVGIAAPIHGAAGDVVASVSVAALASRLPTVRQRDVTEQVRAVARTISERLAAADG